MHQQSEVSTVNLQMVDVGMSVNAAIYTHAGNLQSREQTNDDVAIANMAFGCRQVGVQQDERSTVQAHEIQPLAGTFSKTNVIYEQLPE